MTQTPRFGFALAYVEDTARARHFYEEVLGLKAEREHPNYVQFEHFALASDESLSGTRELELYWLVDDAETAFRAMSPQAEVTLPLTEKPFGKVFAVRDGDGHPRYVLELAQVRPSQPVG